MEVHFPADIESQLHQLASRQGIEAEKIVQESVRRTLDNQARFLAGVERGIEAADRGEFVESDEVWANVEKILQS